MKKIIDALSGPGTNLLSVLAFLFGIVSVNFLYDSAILFFDVYFRMDEWWVLLIFGGGAILIAFIFVVLQPVWVSRSTRLQVVSNVTGHQGLIVIASTGKGISSARGAIEYHRLQKDEKNKLKFVEILSGPGEGTESSRAQAEALKQEYELLGIEVNILDIDDGEDPAQSFAKTLHAIDDLRRVHKLQKSQIIADYTGGNKSMSAGLFMACYSQGCAVQFMKPKKVDSNGRADYKSGSAPKLVEFSFGNPFSVPIGDRNGKNLPV